MAKIEWLTTAEFIELAKEAGYLNKESTWKDGRKSASRWHSEYKLGSHTETGRLRFNKKKVMKFFEGK